MRHHRLSLPALFLLSVLGVTGTAQSFQRSVVTHVITGIKIDPNKIKEAADATAAAGAAAVAADLAKQHKYGEAASKMLPHYKHSSAMMGPIAAKVALVSKADAMDLAIKAGHHAGELEMKHKGIAEDLAQFRKDLVTLKTPKPMARAFNMERLRAYVLWQALSHGRLGPLPTRAATLTLVAAGWYEVYTYGLAHKGPSADWHASDLGISLSDKAIQDGVMELAKDLQAYPGSGVFGAALMVEFIGIGKGLQ